MNPNKRFNRKNENKRAYSTYHEKLILDEISKWQVTINHNVYKSNIGKHHTNQKPLQITTIEIKKLRSPVHIHNKPNNRKRRETHQKHNAQKPASYATASPPPSGRRAQSPRATAPSYPKWASTNTHSRPTPTSSGARRCNPRRRGPRAAGGRGGRASRRRRGPGRPRRRRAQARGGGGGGGRRRGGRRGGMGRREGGTRGGRSRRRTWIGGAGG